MPQRLGQHFLRDAGWRAKILRALAPRPTDVWLEVGAGHGEMTRELVRASRHVIAIEKDPPLIRALESISAEPPNLIVVPGDILEVDLAKAFREIPRFARNDSADEWNGKLRVYGSLPYYITSPILHRLFEHADRIESIAVVIQLEVAARLVARPGSRDYGYLSVLAQFYSQPEIVLRLPPGAFSPPPKVASALVKMRMPGARSSLGVRDEAAFLKFVQACFAQKRKTLLNNLRALMPPERAATVLTAAGIPPRARAEELPLPQFAGLFQAAAP